MAFKDDIAAFGKSLEVKGQKLLVGTAELIHTSIKDGHPLTGAPGQPVDTGTLLNSWVLGFPATNLAEITTNLVYAPPIEDGVGPFGPLTLRSPVGGFHSVKLTRAAWPRIVEHVAREVNA